MRCCSRPRSAAARPVRKARATRSGRPGNGKPQRRKSRVWISAALARLLAFGTTRSLDSLLIARHGRIVLDAYYAPYTPDIPHALNSSTKAVVGTLAAIAHREGLLDSYDHKMLDFFADHTIANLDDRKKAITVQNLLDMTSGLGWEEGITGGREQSLADLRRSPDSDPVRAGSPDGDQTRRSLLLQ